MLVLPNVNIMCTENGSFPLGGDLTELHVSTVFTCYYGLYVFPENTRFIVNPYDFFRNDRQNYFATEYGLESREEL